MLSSEDKINLIKMMILYTIISYIVSPGIGYYLLWNKDGITFGIVVGSLISIILWFQYGQKLVTIE